MIFFVFISSISEFPLLTSADLNSGLQFISIWSFCLSAVPLKRHLEEERVWVVSQLAQELGLDSGVDTLLAVLQGRVHLPGGQVQLPAEGDSHHIHVISAVAEGARQRDEH